MKKIIALLLFLVMWSCLFVSCGTHLSGTYQCEDRYPNIDGKVHTITFNGNKCTICEGSLSYDDLDWTLNEDMLFITGDVNFILGNVHFDYAYTFSQKGDSIFLDGVEFTKQ